MLQRFTALLVMAFWAGMMSWLVYHDVWPAWSAQDPPVARAGLGDGTGRSASQVGIFDARGHRIGSAWSSSLLVGETVSREDLVWIERFPGLPPTRIVADSTFGAGGHLEEVRLEVHGHDMRIRLIGERFAHQLAFQLTAGPRDFKFKIPDSQTGMMGQMFRPFGSLGALRVGQTWRMQVFNPFAAASGLGSPLTSMLVQVTGKQTLVRGGAAVECFVVEAPGSRALVGPDGVVLEQQVQLPVGGTIHVREERFDDEARIRAKSLSLPPFEE